ncbi:MAG: hypothetical protein E7514_01145 [Ruminococcaceae bacterium]|nr:hypothetical protein [Oscillospiraceae bacterium]
MNKNITQLAEIYRNDDRILTEMIEEQKKRMKSLRGVALHTANREMLMLYEMRRDVRATAEHLEHYYDKNRNLTLCRYK